MDERGYMGRGGGAEKVSATAELKLLMCDSLILISSIERVNSPLLLFMFTVGSVLSVMSKHSVLYL